jgi:hypothetical protein
MHSVTLSDGQGTVMAEGHSPSSKVTVSGTVVSNRLTPGHQTWQLKDGDGSSTPMAVKVLDRAFLFAGATAGAGGYTMVGYCARYDETRASWIGYATTVHIQELQRARWVTVSSVTSPGNGSGFSQTVSHSPGKVTVRLSTPETATIGGASSPSAIVQIS